MRLPRSLALLALVLTTTASARPAPKPTAPVELALSARRVERGVEVTLTAIPTRDLDHLELVLDGQRRRFGATARGVLRELRTTIAIATGTGRDVVGGAIAARRSKAAMIRIGAPRVAPRHARTTRRLPDGRTIQEVR